MFKNLTIFLYWIANSNKELLTFYLEILRYLDANITYRRHATTEKLILWKYISNYSHLLMDIIVVIVFIIFWLIKKLSLNRIELVSIPANIPWMFLIPVPCLVYSTPWIILKLIWSNYFTFEIVIKKIR